ncbi:MAG: 3-deoxy-7-phosphoheptulonate synthase, partial [Firmicutes bacterium]|nr:3-deoxy-7-phosphoheptulonate synthase [Bacillota bacterium]
MFIEQKKLPDIEFCRNAAPLSNKLAERKAEFDEALRDNFEKRGKLTVVCGPCAADDSAAMSEYLTKLKKISSDCANLLIAARIYTSKPHSDGQGYKGACFHLRNGDDADLTEGILRCRRLMIECIEIGFPVADELLYPELYGYFSDLVSYWFVGARSSEDSLHRAFASGLNVCCGVKNGTDGDIDKAVESLYAVSR